ncbi:GNAT family N-acetyltransferase [Geosporobacter ferrireducens]|uniref:N-acetyltransferase domain-containing protein n=1 Tax=Geosporobacter ferrireducens TaxID=1424294 RepID=A0A1D8GCH7_9FIRM|nr:GNAT family N-acetyltransferase [Geosporobacter ferrireducens]AOT68613.1 hypothetical protein Gferi_02775 [Geosporobacter ferrireducens]MTI54084.1 GNAT family N-acetyltransferase [Geosporobacter ferrireducens]
MQKYVLTTLSENYAKEICNWRYEGDYAVYNFSDWNVVVKNGWDLAVKERRESDFLAILLDNRLIAFGRLTTSEGKAFIGIGLEPSICGKGIGKDVMKLLIIECKKRFPECIIALEVRSFNKRAIKCYENVGFEIKDKYINIKNRFVGDTEFVYMEYQPTQQ